MRATKQSPPSRPEVQNGELRSNSELAAVASDGLWGHPLTLTLVCLASGVVSDHPLVMCAFVLAFGLQTATRLILVRHVSPDESKNGPRWRRRMMTTLTFSGALWGALTAWACAAAASASAAS